MASYGLLLIARLASVAVTLDNIGSRVLVALLAGGAAWALATVLRRRWLDFTRPRAA